MPDWKAFVRERLQLPELDEHREERILEELAGQLQDLYETALESGRTEAEAERQALEEFPDWDDLSESIAAAERPNCRSNGARLLEHIDTRLRGRGAALAHLANLVQDLRYAARNMRQRVGFTAAVVLCLGIGIGANVALFEIAASVLRPDLPAGDSDDLVQVFMMWEHGNVYAPFSIPDYEDLRDRVGAFEETAAWGIQAFAVAVSGEPARTWGAMVSGNYFRTMGVRTELGRTFAPEEDLIPDRYPVVVISHGLWQRRFGGDPDVIGRSLLVNGSPFTVIGVVEREFTGCMIGTYSDIYVPLAMRGSAMPGWSYFGRQNHWLTSVVARVRDDISIGQAQSEVDALMGALREQYPEENRGANALVLSIEDSLLHPAMRTGFRSVFALLGVVVGVMLLLTCANVTGLMLARSAARQREFGVRLALGASRSRLARQILVESTLYALVAGAVGYLFTVGVVPAVMSVRAPVDLPIRFDASLGTTAVWLTPLFSIVVAFIVGFAPGLDAARKDVAASLTPGRGAGSPPLYRIRHMLVAGQIAASLLLLVGAAMGLKSLMELRGVDLGFNPDNQVIAGFDLSAQGYDERRGRVFYRDLKQSLLEVPGVQAVGFSNRLQLSFSRGVTLAWPEGWESPNGMAESVSRNLVDDGYFDAMQVRITSGRAFNPADVGEAGRVLIVNERFAEKYWPGQNAVGKRVRLGNRIDGPIYEVIGVAETGKYVFVGEDPEPYFYRSFNQIYNGQRYLHVRTSGDPTLFFGEVRRAVRHLDPNLALSRLSTMSDQMGFAFLPSQLIAWSVSAFAAVALLLTTIGLYGLIAHTVAQQTREIGIRMAMGARASTLIFQVLGRIVRHAAVGLAVGLVLAGVGTLFVSRVLYGVSPLDPLAVGAALLFICGAVLLACYLPARRATTVNPVSALNCE